MIITNGDKIRAMDDEDLAREIVSHKCSSCDYCVGSPESCAKDVLKYLKREV